jgi:hypothetical protein
MEDINLGARPDVLPYVKLEAVEFKITDPTAADPTAPVSMLFTDQTFTMHFVIKLTGIWKSLFNGADEKWETHFYADAIGIDVEGELRWTPVPAPLPTPKPADTYDLTYTLVNGIATEGIYEFGAITRLPAMLVNAYIEGYHVEIAEH